jgi:hypothetical protein
LTNIFTFRQEKKNKVAIISTSLGNGSGKFASLLSFMLENLNIEVHTIINDAVDYEYAGSC